MIEALRVLIGDAERRAGASGEEPAARVRQPLVSETGHGAGRMVRTLELVHLSLRDQSQGVRPEFDGLPVDQVASLALTDPDQLVVVVPVRLAQLGVADARKVEL